MGSLFDGSGGFPLAAEMCGIMPVWASEVEPYPIAVTKSRFPAMKHLGDISKINGALIKPVDIITFGSPCQDMSVAGKRAGIKHTENGDEETTRSGLFMEAVRIIKEMREATNGKHPTYAVWENVPGAFSSNKGEDFKIVLEELIKIAEPEAPALPMLEKNRGGWSYADVIMGNRWSIAYRVFDAKYWGVPQRRKRIHLVADFRGQRAGKVLFERESLRGDFKESRAPRQGTAADSERSTETTDKKGGITAYSFDSLASNSMKSKNPHSGCRVVEISKTLDTTYPDPSKNQGGIAIVQQIYDCRGNGDGKTAPTITGDHNNRVTDYTACIVEPKTYCLQGSMIGRQDKNGPQGDGVNENISFTLNATDRHGVAYSIGNGQINSLKMEEVCKTLDCMHDKQAVLINKPPQYIVRRLTPTECARLQGFPDTWGHPDKKTELTDAEYIFWLDVRNTHAAINGRAVKEYTKAQMLTWYNKLHTDSAEYKMWGNGIALPPALYVMQGIAEEAERERE